MHPDAADIAALFELPFSDLIYRAQTLHRRHFDPNAVQLSTLLSIKTGGCSEDCGYCSQSARFHTDVKNQPLLSKEEVVAAARTAQERGATRFCMGAAWRGPKEKDLAEGGGGEKQRAGGGDGERVGGGGGKRGPNPKVRGDASVASRARTSESMGPDEDTKFQVSIKPLTDATTATALDPIEFVRTVAAARIAMPTSFVRLSAGRSQMPDHLQALCFLAGANSIFYGDRLLTTPNPESDADLRLFE